MKSTKYLVAIADTHGNNQALRKISGYLRTLLEKYNKPLNDCAILYLGDVLPFEKIPEQDVAKHTKEFTDALANAELPVIGVGGNHDIEDAMKVAFKEKEWIYLHGETAEWNGLKFAGYGGAPFPPLEVSEGTHGLPKERFVQYSDKDLIAKLGNADVDIFLHHAPPPGFGDIMAFLGNTTLGGEPELCKAHVGPESIDDILDKTKPILSISGHVHESTASKTKDRTVYIKCHGFEPRYGFAVYYVEIAYDQDDIPYVKSNVDISFEIGEDSARPVPGGLAFDPKAFALLTPRPVVTCREEYECTAEKMVHHYRIQKSREHGVIVKFIKTPKGFKPIDHKPALTGADDISWAFAGDEEQDDGKRRLIIEP